MDSTSTYQKKLAALQKQRDKEFKAALNRWEEHLKTMKKWQANKK